LKERQRAKYSELASVKLKEKESKNSIADIKQQLRTHYLIIERIVKKCHDIEVTYTFIE
jgi:hypothetical protein